jgi:hypothetical protein
MLVVVSHPRSEQGLSARLRWAFGSGGRERERAGNLFPVIAGILLFPVIALIVCVAVYIVRGRLVEAGARGCPQPALARAFSFTAAELDLNRAGRATFGQATLLLPDILIGLMLFAFGCALCGWLFVKVKQSERRLVAALGAWSFGSVGVVIAFAGGVEGWTSAADLVTRTVVAVSGKPQVDVPTRGLTVVHVGSRTVLARHRSDRVLDHRQTYRFYVFESSGTIASVEAMPEEARN